mgnify:FL=1
MVGLFQTVIDGLQIEVFDPIVNLDSLGGLRNCLNLLHLSLSLLLLDLLNLLDLLHLLHLLHLLLSLLHLLVYLLVDLGISLLMHSVALKSWVTMAALNPHWLLLECTGSGVAGELI